MATNSTTAAKDAATTKTAAEIEAERKAQEVAAKDAAETAGAAATEEARARDAETLKAQEQSRPYPSQEEADAIKAAGAVGAAPYATRAMKA